MPARLPGDDVIFQEGVEVINNMPKVFMLRAIGYNKWDSVILVTWLIL